MSDIAAVYHRELTAELTENLKNELRPIVADETLTKDQRGKKFVPILKRFSGGLSFDEACSIWNNAMAELVVELGLARH